MEQIVLSILNGESIDSNINEKDVCQAIIDFMPVVVSKQRFVNLIKFVTTLTIENEVGLMSILVRNKSFQKAFVDSDHPNVYNCYKHLIQITDGKVRNDDEYIQQFFLRFELNPNFLNSHFI